MRRNHSDSIAFGGVTAALAVVIMCIGGLIPVATYVSPLICCLLLQIVLFRCGKRTAWTWFFAVSFLGVLLGPDKESAMVFSVLGYYPIVKPKLDKSRIGWILKLILLNASVAALYTLLLYVMGAERLGLGNVGLVLFLILVVLGNVTLFLLDWLLKLFSTKLMYNKGRR